MSFVCVCVCDISPSLPPLPVNLLTLFAAAVLIPALTPSVEKNQ